jgi:membrane-bound serine protease (ClpP class)
MKQKLENFAATYIQAIAEKRGRNAAWAQTAVRQSASLTAKAAKASNVVEILAVDLPDLVKQLDGRKVQNHLLKTAGADIRPIPVSIRERMFQMLWRPEVLTLLMLVAIYGIIAEFSHPGAVLPGVAGFIALVLALYMSSILPINFAGVALILLAVGLFVTEAFIGASGWLTVGGIVSFFFGLLMLFDRDDPAFRLSLRFIIPATLITASFFIFIVAAAWRARRLPVKSGREAMVGKIIPTITPVNAQGGKVFVEGEYWNAVSPDPVPEGALVIILAVRGLTLEVKPNS